MTSRTPPLTAIETRDHIPGWLALHGMTRLVEVGVREGKNLQCLLGAKPELLVAVDIWRDDGVPSHNDRGEKQDKLDQFFAGVQALASANPCIQVIRAYSLDAAKLFDDGSFDFVYLDADHGYEAIKADIAAWAPKVRSGGVLAGHDYLRAVVGLYKTRVGVIQAVDEFVASIGGALHTTAARERYASWFVRIP